MKQLNEEYKEPDYEKVIKETDDDEFDIGQIYEKQPAKKIVCKKCKTDKWIVGVGSHFTAIKCPNCSYQICIHDG